jgi:hypothetical protein
MSCEDPNYPRVLGAIKLSLRNFFEFPTTGKTKIKMRARVDNEIPRPRPVLPRDDAGGGEQLEAIWWRKRVPELVAR